MQLVATFLLVLAYAAGFGLVAFVATCWTWQWLRVALSTAVVIVDLALTLGTFHPAFDGLMKALFIFFSNPFVLGVLTCWFLFLWLYYRRKQTMLGNEGEQE